MRYVSYLRVSTQRQGQSGLGLEAQRSTVETHVRSCGGSVVAEFVEVESGRKDDRPQLKAALAACRLYGARLVIARLDRLSRNASFLLALRDDGVDFVACDAPHANRLTIGVLALVAEDEAERISARTKAALAAAKVRGTVLGNPGNLSRRDVGSARGGAVVQAKADGRAKELSDTIRGLQALGVNSLRGLASALNDKGIPAGRGGLWKAETVRRVLSRINAEVAHG